MARRTLRDRLAEQPFTLALSGGFFGFYAHAGALEAIRSAGLTPSRITGVSAGAVVAAAWAAGLDAPALTDTVLRLERRHFWDPFPGLGLIRGRRLEERLRRTLPVHDFASCRVPVAISVNDIFARRIRVLTEGDLPRAVRASCSVPFLFHPVFQGFRPMNDGGTRDPDALAGITPSETTLLIRLRTDSTPPSPNVHVIALTYLPSVGPYKLDRGRSALDQARTGTAAALARPIY